jgi:hypothetical protein
LVFVQVDDDRPSRKATPPGNGLVIRANRRAAQACKDGTRLGARDRDRHAVLPDLERPQNPQLHRSKRSHVAIVGGPIQHTVKFE